MSAAATQRPIWPPIWQVRAAWGALVELPVGARRVGTALVELLDWTAWSSPEPVACDDTRRGITRRAIAERANVSTRTVTRALADLRLAGLLTVKTRTWLQSWYALDAESLVDRALAARRAAKDARVRAVLGVELPAAPPAAVVKSKGAEALERAAQERHGRPRWADASKRPNDLARLAWVYTSALHPGQAPELFEGRYAARLEKLRRQHCTMPVETFAEQLSAVAAWVRGEGRIQVPTRTSHVTRTVHAADALRPAMWARIVDTAVTWWRDYKGDFDPGAMVEALVSEHGVPCLEAQAFNLAALARDKHRLTERQESAVLYELLQRVPGRLRADEPEAVPEPEPEARVELDPGLLAKLALCVPEIEGYVAELGELAPLPGIDAPLPFQERKAAGSQRRLRGLLSDECAQWLQAAGELLAAPAEGSPARLHDLAEALSRLRELHGRLAR